MERRTEEGQNRRIKEIEELKKRKNLINSLSSLRNTSGWNSFREVINQSIEAQQKMIDMHLDADESSASFHEARAFKKVKRYAEYLRDLVEKPDENLSAINEKIESLNAILKESESEIIN